MAGVAGVGLVTRVLVEAERAGDVGEGVGEAVGEGEWECGHARAGASEVRPVEHERGWVVGRGQRLREESRLVTPT